MTSDQTPDTTIAPDSPATAAAKAAMPRPKTKRAAKPTEPKTGGMRLDVDPGPGPDHSAETDPDHPDHPEHAAHVARQEERLRLRAQALAALANAASASEAPEPVGYVPPTLEPLDKRVRDLTSELAALRAEAEAIEAEHARNTKTCLSYGMQIVKCRWMTMHLSADSDFPTWSTPPGGRSCHLGKKEPDQECRHCPYVQIVPFGSTPNFSPNGRRYHDHGMVIPIPNQEVADRLSEFVTKELGLAPLRDVAQELVGLEDALKMAKAQRAETANRIAIEAAQRGHPSLRHRIPASRVGPIGQGQD